jgi:hypothetical protein
MGAFFPAIRRLMVAAAESASRHDLKALDYPILPKSPSASKREFSELPNSARHRRRKSRIVYTGESLRVVTHRANGRPFDQVYYIATTAKQRVTLERILIKAIKLVQAFCIILLRDRQHIQPKIGSWKTDDELLKTFATLRKQGARDWQLPPREQINLHNFD